MDRTLFSDRIIVGNLTSEEIINHFMEEDQMEMLEIKVDYFSTGDEDFDVSRQKDCWLFQQEDVAYLFLDNGKIIELRNN